MINCANAKCNEHFTQCDECGWKLDGCCSTECQSVPDKREYDGTGYYVKIPQPVNVEKISKRKHKNFPPRNKVEAEV